MYIQTKDLPQSIRALLIACGYNKADIAVSVKESVSPQIAGGDSYRGIFAVTKISENIEEVKLTYGSWGGANLFTANAVDSLEKTFALPENFCVFKGTQGGTQPVLGELFISPKNAALLLPAQEVLSDDEKRVLAGYKGLTSAGRKEHFARISGFSKIQNTLLEKGYIVKKGNGVSITTEGKNALGENYSHYL